MHIIICQDGSGRYLAERALVRCDAVGGITDETTFDSVWLDIANGQVQHPIRVLAVKIDHGEQGVVTDESVRVASMVLRYALSNGESYESNDSRLTFVELHLGSQRANAVRKVYPNIAARA